MKQASRAIVPIALIALVLLLIALLPWAMVATGAANTGLAWGFFALEIIALLLLILDLSVFGNISRMFGAVVNQWTSAKSFSLPRIAYLILVYGTPVSAVFGLLAWLL